MEVNIQAIMPAAKEGKLEELESMLPHATPFHTSNAMSSAISGKQSAAFEMVLKTPEPKQIGAALGSACYEGQPWAVKRPLEAGAPPNGNNDDGFSLLRVVCNGAPAREADFVACVRLLLEAGADADKPDEAGCTPIMNLARTGFSLEALKIPVEAGVDLKRKCKRSWSALKWARFDYQRRDKSEIEAYQTSKGAK